MAIKLLAKIFLFAIILHSFAAYAENIEKNTARMQAMDKITGRVSMINVPVNGEVKFGSLSIVARSCKTRPAEETPDNFAFIDVTDTSPKGITENIFKGWMISSSPATHAVEHPIYDVWLLQCTDTKIDPKVLLSEQELTQRDELPMQGRTNKNASNASKETKAASAQEPIEEMTAEHQPETYATEMLLPEEFSFDEGEENVTADEGEENVTADESEENATADESIDTNK